MCSPIRSLPRRWPEMSIRKGRYLLMRNLPHALSVSGRAKSSEKLADGNGLCAKQSSSMRLPLMLHGQRGPSPSAHAPQIAKFQWADSLKIKCRTARHSLKIASALKWPRHLSSAQSSIPQIEPHAEKVDLL